MDHQHSGRGASEAAAMRKQYRILGLNLLVSLAIMYVVMFSMIYSLDEFFNNVNMLYMAATMAAPMAILMLWMMRAMYADKRLNAMIYAGSALLFILAFIGVRGQVLVGDRQFLRSMIPHHSGAILMCERSKLSDPEIVALCGRIIQSQKEEIAQMKTLLARTNGS